MFECFSISFDDDALLRYVGFLECFCGRISIPMSDSGRVVLLFM